MKDLLSIKECSEPRPILCSTAQGKMHAPLVQCCSAKQAHSKLVSREIHI